MAARARVLIRPKEGILDPQGKAVERALPALGFEGIEQVYVRAITGVWLLTVLSQDARLIALGIVLALTVYGELRSISATIDRVPPLRWLDPVGRA